LEINKNGLSIDFYAKCRYVAPLLKVVSLNKKIKLR